MHRSLKNPPKDFSFKEVCRDLTAPRVSNSCNEMIALSQALKDLVVENLASSSLIRSEPTASQLSPPQLHDSQLTPQTAAPRLAPQSGAVKTPRPEMSPELAQALLALQRKTLQMQVKRPGERVAGGGGKSVEFSSADLPSVSAQVKTRGWFQKETSTRPILRPKV